MENTNAENVDTLDTLTDDELDDLYREVRWNGGIAFTSYRRARLQTKRDSFYAQFKECAARQKAIESEIAQRERIAQTTPSTTEHHGYTIHFDGSEYTMQRPNGTFLMDKSDFDGIKHGADSDSFVGIVRSVPFVVSARGWIERDIKERSEVK